MSDTTPIAAGALPEGEYAIVEALGHRTLVGRVSEVERFGTKLLQVEPLFADVMLGPVLLCGGPPKRGFGRYDLTVLDFRRYGMNGAAPVFWNWDYGRFVGAPNRADELAAPVIGREHHANWFADIDHPDARLIAAAPELYEAAALFIPTGVCLTNRNIPDDMTIPMDVTMGDLRKLRAALAKANGHG